MPDNEIRDEDVRQALDDLLAWPEISRSVQLGKFLRYIVEARIAGADETIKAYAIAVDVFGRPENFDPQADPIVRVQARRLRILLERFYAGGNEGAAYHGKVRIRLPLGRYVPEFELAQTPVPIDPPALEKLPPSMMRPLAPARWTASLVWRGLTLLVVLGMIVWGAYALKWLPLIHGAVADPPPEPVVLVGAFNNFAGDDGIDASVAALPGQIATGLERFPILKAKVIPKTGRPAGGAGTNVFILTGVVRNVGDKINVQALLSSSTTHAVVWTTSVHVMAGNPERSDFLLDAGQRIVSQLAASEGPLHALGRDWLARQFALPNRPSLYTCLLQFQLARESGPGEAVAVALACLSRFLEQTPDSGIGLAAWAGLAASVAARHTEPGQEVSSLLAVPIAKARAAVALDPRQSFVHEQLGNVLAVNNEEREAAAAYRDAIELNSANLDARAELGRLLAFNGEWTVGTGLAQVAIDRSASPAPWYYLGVAVNDFREQRDADALIAALVLAKSDNQFGPVIALVSAKRAGHPTLVPQLLLAVMNNEDFRRSGILPRLGLTLKDTAVLQMIGDWLLSAGVPQRALVQPF